MCATKQVVKQQVEPRLKPQEQIKINHDDGSDLMMKKKTRRGEKSKASYANSRCQDDEQE
jgi:hypothetical protein